jgi:hypothetical protein
MKGCGNPFGLGVLIGIVIGALLWASHFWVNKDKGDADSSKT